MRITNVHERIVDAKPEAAGRLVDGLSGPADRLWPTAHWPAQRFDRALGVGAKGGHGPIRYVVDAYEPGRHVSYGFVPPTGLHGRHWLDVVADGGGGVRFRHVVFAEAGWVGWLRWALVVRWLHDALVEDAFDRAEQELTGRIRSPAQWSWWVRVLRWAWRPRSTATDRH
ncbi:MAG: SRPBCC family protein [Myxococcota bacterium]